MSGVLRLKAMGNDFKNSDEYNKIFSFHETIANRIISRESSWLEFKESFNWTSKAKYAKSMVAFANAKGGYIIFGVKDKSRDIIGLQSNNFEDATSQKLPLILIVFLRQKSFLKNLQ